MCQAIVGCQSSYDNIMSVDVTCRFVATMLSISPKQLNFNMSKVGPKIMSTTVHHIFNDLLCHAVLSYIKSSQMFGFAGFVWFSDLLLILLVSALSAQAFYLKYVNGWLDGWMDDYTTKPTLL